MLQLTGPITLGGTDYSDDVTSIIIRRRRAVVTSPATFGNAREVGAAGAISEEIQVNFLNHIAASRVWAELWDAIDSDNAELAFTARFTDGAVAADNPEFSGTCVITGVEVGGAVLQHNQQSWTFPVTAAGITKDVTP